MWPHANNTSAKRVYSAHTEVYDMNDGTYSKVQAILNNEHIHEIKLFFFLPIVKKSKLSNTELLFSFFIHVWCAQIIFPDNYRNATKGIRVWHEVVWCVSSIDTFLISTNVKVRRINSRKYWTLVASRRAKNYLFHFFLCYSFIRKTVSTMMGPGTHIYVLRKLTKFTLDEIDNERWYYIIW